ncbi:Protein kinase domain - like 10 [Theobroma cacao]|nr:Protein kinase domain - like 10 [Theobroma cacao]
MKAQNAESFFLNSGKPTTLFIFCILLFGLVAPSKATIHHNTNFNFTPLNPNVREIDYEGDASPSDNGIQLTINQMNKGLDGSVGRATYSKPMHLWDNSSGNIVLADFTTQFSFVIDSLKSSSIKADGFAFFLAPNGSKIPPDSEGGFLGLESGDPTCINDSFVAVEFDTYPNPWDPVKYDHVAIDRNAVNNSLKILRWWWSDTENGGMVDAFISYNSSTKNLTVALLDTDDITRKNSSSLSTILDLSKDLPEWVTFGFSGTTGSSFELHTIYSWSFSSSLEIDNNISDHEPNFKRRKNRTGLAVALGVAGALVGGIFLVWLASLYRKKFGRDEENGHVIDEEIDDEFERGTGPRKFSYDELAHATDNFQDVGKLGEGGFGGVYKGFLRDSSSYVAIKRVSGGSKQGIKEYASEVKIISRLRHRNLVQLIGWCHDKKELLLVYEFMPNGSLDSHLFQENSLLTWEVRYKIAQGLASGLLYLHEGWEQCVVHRDIKSSNVLLDSDFNAKLGDFGLARLVDHAKGSQTTVLAGTVGYLAPECHIAGKASRQSDVYSFGVVALEIACGKKPIDPKAGEGKVNLVERVWELYGTGKLLEACDPRLRGEFVKEEMEQLLIIGLWCAHPDENSRPSIQQAIHVLNFEAPLPILPSKKPMPIYYAPPLNVPAFPLSYSGTDSEGQQNQFSSYSYGTNSSQFTASSSSSASASLLSARQV